MEISEKINYRILKDDQKRDFLDEHFYHEVIMLIVSSQELLLGAVTLDSARRNVFVENFALHARNLIEFYLKEKKYDDDPKLEDFISNAPEWVDQARKMFTLSETDVWTLANKGISHLTYSRLRYDEHTKGWNILILTRDLLRITNSFLSFLPEKYKAKNLHSLIDLLEGNPLIK